MFGLDEWVAELGAGHPLLLASAIAVLLGLRHATDPDHLTAVTTLVAGGRERQARHAARLGVAWGAGHASTLAVFGLPLILFAQSLPGWAQQAAEASVGVLVIVLAVRLLRRWRRGELHAHPHRHRDTEHVHLHGHDHDRDTHVDRPVRSAAGAYSIGLMHGIGGSAGVGALLLAGIENRPLAVVALLVFALFSAVSMGLCSGLFGMGLSTAWLQSGFGRLAPVLGVASLSFGVWYVAGALALAAYPL